MIISKSKIFLYQINTWLLTKSNKYELSFKKHKTLYFLFLLSINCLKSRFELLVPQPPFKIGTTGAMGPPQPPFITCRRVARFL
jgi:hypothetical protein